MINILIIYRAIYALLSGVFLWETWTCLAKARYLYINDIAKSESGYYNAVIIAALAMLFMGVRTILNIWILAGHELTITRIISDIAIIVAVHLLNSIIWQTRILPQYLIHPRNKKKK